MRLPGYFPTTEGGSMDPFGALLRIPSSHLFSDSYKKVEIEDLWSHDFRYAVTCVW